MPMPISLAHKLVKQLSMVRKQKLVDYLRPDGKAQVSVEYVDGRPVRVDTVVLSAQHSAEVERETLERLDGAGYKKAILLICLIKHCLLYQSYRSLCNWRPAGVRADRQKNNCGYLRRIRPTRGGAGKDPTKVSFSGICSRYVENIVAGLQISVKLNWICNRGGKARVHNG